MSKEVPTPKPEPIILPANSRRRLSLIRTTIAGGALTLTFSGLGGGLVNAQNSPEESPIPDSPTTLVEPTVPDNMTPLSANVDLTEAEKPEEYADEYIGTFNTSTMEFKARVFNQTEESIRNISYEELKDGIDKFYRENGDEIRGIDIPGWPLITEEDLKWYLPQLKRGTQYSRELASQEESEVDAKRIINDSRLTTASEIVTNFFLMHDNTISPKLKISIEDVTDLAVDYTVSSLADTHSEEDVADHMDGYVEYMARNYRYKAAYAPDSQS